MKRNKLSTAMKNNLTFNYKKSLKLDKILEGSDLKVPIMSIVAKAFKAGIEKTEKLHGII